MAVGLKLGRVGIGSMGATDRRFSCLFEACSGPRIAADCRHRRPFRLKLECLRRGRCRVAGQRVVPAQSMPYGAHSSRNYQAIARRGVSSFTIRRHDEAAVWIAQSPDSNKALKEAQKTLETL